MTKLDESNKHVREASGNVEIDPIMELSMKILFAAPEKARGGLLDMLREELPEHQVDATGAFRIDSLKGYDVVIPCIAPVTAELIIDADRLKLIQHLLNNFTIECGVLIQGIGIPDQDHFGPVRSLG